MTSVAERQGAERWQLTGVDLDTRRRRVLEELALKGRIDEQARFRAELAEAVRSLQQTEDLSRLERVVEGWYRQAVACRVVPRADEGRSATRAAQRRSDRHEVAYASAQELLVAYRIDLGARRIEVLSLVWQGAS